MKLSICPRRRATVLFFSLAAVQVFCERPATADWATYQGDVGHTGYVPGNTSAASIPLLWKDTLSPYALGGLAIGGNNVYVKTPAYSITALNDQTGATVWTDPFAGGVGKGQVDTLSMPAYANGMVYFQTDNEDDVNLFHGVSAKTGAQVFATPYGAQWETYLNPLPYDGNVYTGGGTYGGIYSYNASTGNQNWFGTEGQYDGWTPSTDGKYLYSYTGSGSITPIYGQFRMINMSTGVTTYLVTDTGFKFGGYTMNNAVVMGSHNDAIVANGGSSGRLLSFSIQADATHTPHIQWALSDNYTGQPTLANGVVYVDDGTAVVALDELSGNKLWSWNSPTGSVVVPMVATDNTLFASTSSATYAIDLSSHSTEWSYPASGRLAISDNDLFVAGLDGTVYAFAVPEPSSIGWLAVGLVLVLDSRKRRVKQYAV